MAGSDASASSAGVVQLSDRLDNEVLNLIARMLDTHSQDALLVRRLWSDRQALVEGLSEIRNWDMTHSEALGVERVLLIVDGLLHDVYEE